MKYKLKVFALGYEQCEDGLWAWEFFKKITDFKNYNSYERSGCSLPVEEVLNYKYQGGK